MIPKVTSRKSALSRILALTLALMMALSLCMTASAVDDRAKKDPPPYTIDRYGNVTLYVSDTEIKTTWDDDGCELDAQFLSSDSLLRRLRLTFNAPYDLYESYQRTIAANTIGNVLDRTYGQYGCLRDYLSYSTIRLSRAGNGLDFLYDMRNSREYQNSMMAKCLVEWNLTDLEQSQTASLKRSLSFFYSERYLDRLSLVDLQYLAASEIATPEYIVFHNTLFDHDCSTVKALLKKGYSLDYIARLYSNQAKAAVAAIWPDYQQMMDDYWYENRAW